jgi:hypothetical protein
MLRAERVVVVVVVVIIIIIIIIIIGPFYHELFCPYPWICMNEVHALANFNVIGN